MPPTRVQLAVSVASRTATKSRDFVPVDRTVMLPGRAHSSDDRVLAVVDACDEAVAAARVTLQAAFDHLASFRAMSDAEQDRYLEGVLRSASRWVHSPRPVPIALAVWTDGRLLIGTIGGSHAYICRPAGEVQSIGCDTDNASDSCVVRAAVLLDTYLVLVGPVVAGSLTLRDIRRAVQSLESATAAATWLSTLAATIGSHDSTVLAVRFNRMPNEPLHETSNGGQVRRVRVWTLSSSLLALLLGLGGAGWLLTGRSNQTGAAVSVIAVTPTIVTTAPTTNPSSQVASDYVFRMAGIILSVRNAQRRLLVAAAHVQGNRRNSQARINVRLALVDLQRSSRQLAAMRDVPQFAPVHRDAQRVVTLMIQACLRVEHGIMAVDAGRSRDAEHQVTLAAKDVSEASHVIRLLTNTG